MNQVNYYFKPIIMDNQLNGQTRLTKDVFANNYLHAKNLYLHHFGSLPNVAYISNIDGEKAYRIFIETYHTLITNTHLYRSYYRNNEKCNFDETVLILTNGCILEFDQYYCEVLYPDTQPDFLQSIIKLIGPVKKRARRQPAEINLIIRNWNGLQLKPMEIKRKKLDIDLFYEDDFAAVHQTISKRLSQKADKGIVLLHGLPGTGKTTYLRYLVGKLKKRVLFLSPGAAANLMDPELVEILINNPNSVLIIEDAENIIMDRKISNASAVSNLLNISDGLLSDFLNVQLICTFNSALTLIDSALMRKGRLIARYEFGKLGIDKAQRLSKHLDFDQTITRPMTIAEISNPNEQNYESKQVQVIGFRREAVLEN